MSDSKEKPRVWRRDNDYFESRLFGAFYLILIGCIFLLNTTGVLSWSIWINILKFWPLFIVSAGIGIIFSGTRILNFIGSVITLLIFLVIVGLSIFNPFVNKWAFIPLSVNSQSKSFDYNIEDNEYKGLKSRDFNINLPLGEVVLEDGSLDYLNLDSTYTSDYEKPDITKLQEGTNLAVDVKNTQSNNFIISTQGPKYHFTIGQEQLETNLNLKFGAGNSEVDFNELVIKDFKVEVGAGNLNVKLSEDSIPNGDFNLKSGLGNITITLPDNVGLKLNYKVGLGNLSLNNSKVTNGSGNSTLKSSNYDEAKVKITMNLEVGLGNIEIVTK